MNASYERVALLFAEQLNLNDPLDRQRMLLVNRQLFLAADLIGTVFSSAECAILSLLFLRLLQAAREEGDRTREAEVLTCLLATLPPETDEYRRTAIDLSRHWAENGRKDERADRLYRLVKTVSKDALLLAKIEKVSKTV